MRINNKGFYLPNFGIITLVFITSVITRGLTETYYNGTLEKHSKVIACKAKGEKADVCNAKYDYTPLPDEVKIKM